MRGNLTIFKKGLILVAVPLLFQLLLIALVAVMEKKNAEAGRWFVHTKEVIGQAQTVLTGLVSAESGSRGYVLTGDPGFTESYDSAARDVPAALEGLRDLVSDNPAQQEKVDQIAGQVAKLMEWQLKNMHLTRDGAREEAVARMKTLQGAKFMDLVRADMEEFVTEEQRLDREREQAFRGSQQWLQGVLVAGAVVSLLGTVVMAFLFNLGISDRLATLSTNAKRFAHGQELAPPLTGNDELTRLDRAFHEMAQELARSTNALRDQSRLLQSVLDNMAEGLVIAGPSGKFLLFNRAAERILGRGPVDGAPDAWTEEYRVYLPDQVTPYPPRQLPLTRAIQGEAVDEDEQFVRPPHEPAGIWLSVTARPLGDESQGRLGGVAVFRDISELKRKEEEIRKLNQGLERRVAERTADLAEANRDLEQKNQENEMFVYSVSHDLRAPLVNLQGFGEELGRVCQDLRALLADEAVPRAVRERGMALLDGDIAESTRFIQTGVLRLSGIIDALLRLSRAGRVEYRWQQVEVGAVVGRVVESLNGTISRRAAKVTYADLPPAWGDPTAVEQVFANLIGNALNYLDPERPGVVEIGSRPAAAADGDAGRAGLRTYYVKDNGLGIPEAYRPKIFQAFQRLNPKAAKGEGIGLVMVRRIVERHGGRIWLESDQGVGSTFFVTLPVPGVKGTANNGERNGVCAAERE